MATSATTPTETPSRPGTDAPLTDPADLLALAGRFLGSVILTFFSILCLVRHTYEAMIGTAAGALFLQFLTVKLWRKLRDERIEAKIARGLATPADRLTPPTGGAA